MEYDMCLYFILEKSYIRKLLCFHSIYKTKPVPICFKIPFGRNICNKKNAMRRVMNILRMA